MAASKYIGLTPCSRVLLKKPIPTSSVTFYGTRRFNILLQTAWHFFHYCATPSDTISLKHTLILSYQLRVHIQEVPFLIISSPNSGAFLFSPIRAACTPRIILLVSDHANNITNFVTMHSFLSPCCLLLVPSIFVSTLPASALSPCSSLMWETMLHIHVQQARLLPIHYFNESSYHTMPSIYSLS